VEWVIQMIAAIKRYWAVPPGSSELSALVKFTLSPTGEVTSATIKQSSGNPVFDHSVLQALYKASPLPLPSDPAAFDPAITTCFALNPRNCVVEGSRNPSAPASTASPRG
jgi:colicin import membrane protein